MTPPQAATAREMSGGMAVVKLGGSLARHPALTAWLKALRHLPRPHARLVVPGGGPFADAVRALEGPLGLDALTAHRCAILAMQQFGLVLLQRVPGLRAVEREEDFAALAHTGGAGVWLPWLLAGRAPELAPSWDVTSDSLAAWLTARLGLRVLLLVKARTPRGSSTPAQLAREELVDRAFPRYAAGLTVRAVAVEPVPDAASLTRLLTP